jgi:hypothetical protein
VGSGVSSAGARAAGAFFGHLGAAGVLRARG